MWARYSNQDFDVAYHVAVELTNDDRNPATACFALPERAGAPYSKANMALVTAFFRDDKTCRFIDTALVLAECRAIRAKLGDLRA
jgi:hypothetical protein